MDPSLVRGAQVGAVGRYDGGGDAAMRSAAMASAGPRPMQSGPGNSPFETGPRGGKGGGKGGGADPYDQERQRLLQRTLDRGGAGGKPMQERQPMHAQTIAAMVAIPCLMFFLCCACTAIAPATTANRAVAWASVFVSFGFALLLLQVHFYSKAMIYMYLGLLGVVATLLGAWCGSSIYDNFTLQYWMGNARPTFHDVTPSLPAAGYANAAALVFTEDSKVDLRRPFGYRGDEAEGEVYCVAPILDPAAAELSEVRFWAIGVDCCMPTWGFTCGAVESPTARSGVVLRKILSSRSATKRYQVYTDAITQAAAMYNLRTSGEPVFVSWTEDATAEISQLFGMAILWVCVLSLLYLMFSLFVAGFLHWRTGRPRQAWQRAPQGLGNFGSMS